MVLLRRSLHSQRQGLILHTGLHSSFLRKQKVILLGKNKPWWVQVQSSSFLFVTLADGLNDPLSLKQNKTEFMGNVVRVFVKSNHK